MDWDEVTDQALHAALAASGLFVPTRYSIEDAGERFRIWKLTPAGRKAVGGSRAA